MSLARAPDATTTNNVKGSSLNFPFWPGEIHVLLVIWEYK